MPRPGRLVSCSLRAGFGDAHYGNRAGSTPERANLDLGALQGRSRRWRWHRAGYRFCSTLDAPRVTTILLALLACAGVIYVSCEYFVNGIEWVGYRLGVARSAVGTVLAAFGTALPESVVTFAAVFGHRTPTEQGIGVGTAMGGPLVLATIAYGVAGLVWLASARPGAQDGRSWLAPSAQRRLAGDQGWFLVLFLAKVVLGVVAFAVKPWLGIAFLAAYAWYTWREIAGGGEAGGIFELEPLKLRPRDASPSLTWALLQTGLALAATFVASNLFVGYLAKFGPMVGLSAQLSALLLSPIATELPETLNAVIWLRQGKLSLALGNISGSMIIQATVPSALGIMLTPWMFDRSLVIAGVVTMLAIATMAWQLRRAVLSPARLAAYALFYLGFVLLLLGPWWRAAS